MNTPAVPLVFWQLQPAFSQEKYLNLDVICLKLAYICVFLCRSLPADLSSLSSPPSNASELQILCDSLAGWLFEGATEPEHKKKKFLGLCYSHYMAKASA